MIIEVKKPEECPYCKWVGGELYACNHPALSEIRACLGFKGCQGIVDKEVLIRFSGEKSGKTV